MGPQQSPPSGAAHPAIGGPPGTGAGPGSTGVPSPAAGAGLGNADGGGTSIGAAAAGAATFGVFASGRTLTAPTGAACEPTTVPPGRAVAMAGSSAEGAWASAVVPVRRAALVSHRRIPCMVCLAAVGGP